MNHNTMRATIVGIFSAITPLAFQVISGYLFENKDSQLFVADFILAIVLGIVSYGITLFILFLCRRWEALQGLYFVVYDEKEECLCSVINIEYEKDNYLIDVYDFACSRKNNMWLPVPSISRGHSNVYADSTLREFHIISNVESANSCIFFKFYNEQRTASVIRYGCSKPFDEKRTGKMFQLSKANLCAVFNSSFVNDQFCNKKTNVTNVCRDQNRKKCHQCKRKILHWVRQENDNDYIKIPQYLYKAFAEKLVPVEAVLSSEGAVAFPDSPDAPVPKGSVASPDSPVAPVPEDSVVSSESPVPSVLEET